MRSEASILHLDLDAFFAAVEQRDKPSLRGRPVVVGGVGARGVVATASYEARAYGVRSAMSAAEARRRCPHAAFLAGRHDRYRAASRQVMAVLRELSPRVEPLSLDEAFVDLAAAPGKPSLAPEVLRTRVTALKHEVAAATGGLTASVGIGTSKFIAKLATELAKPDGLTLVEPGTEADLIAPMGIEVIPGVGPVTAEKLRRIGIRTVADLRSAGRDELIRLLGRAAGEALSEFAWARDDRPVEPERESKSISTEDTFETDLVDGERLRDILDSHARQVAARLHAAALLARTVSIKVRLHDFSTHTRSRTLLGGTDSPELISELARSLLTGVDTTGGVRLLGVGASGLAEGWQEELFPTTAGDATSSQVSVPRPPEVPRPALTRWVPGADVRHDEHGPGWVWGAGRGLVTVRFETAHTRPGPVRTFAVDDPALHLDGARLDRLDGSD